MTIHFRAAFERGMALIACVYRLLSVLKRGFRTSANGIITAHISSLFFFAAWNGVLCHYLDYIRTNEEVPHKSKVE
jgi:hypothetical protein